jgi:hypothetical protein
VQGANGVVVGADARGQQPEDDVEGALLARSRIERRERVAQIEVVARANVVRIDEPGPPRRRGALAERRAKQAGV